MLWLVLSGQGADAGGPLGPLGLAVARSKVQWREWEVKAASGAVPRATPAYAGDDPHLVDIIERDMLDASPGELPACGPGGAGGGGGRRGGQGQGPATEARDDWPGSLLQAAEAGALGPSPPRPEMSPPAALMKQRAPQGSRLKILPRWTRPSSCSMRRWCCPC